MRGKKLNKYFGGRQAANQSDSMSAPFVQSRSIQTTNRPVARQSGIHFLEEKMNMTKKLYYWIYQHSSSRRAHAHRCRCCWKIIEPGAAVIAWRVNHKVTWMLHESCGDVTHFTDTWLNVFKKWAGVQEVSR